MSYKFTQEVKDKWIEALQSGKYAQGTGALRSEDGEKFCCLGVLCDILDPGGWDSENDFSHSLQNLIYAESTHPEGFLPIDPERLYRRNAGGGDFIDNAQSFDQIANYIKEHVPAEEE